MTSSGSRGKLGRAKSGPRPGGGGSDNRSGDMHYMFNPRGVAVIGASSNPSKIGHKVVSNILNSKYKGPVYPINPGGGEVLGHKAYRSITDVDGIVDLALIAIPSKYVLDAVVECGKKGVKYLVVITSGFAETGNVAEEQQLVRTAREMGMRILGPNVFGLYSASSSMNATFGPENILPGNVAIITQSGALGVAMIGKSAVENIGMSTIISVGNKSDVDENDLLQYLMDQDDTRVIMMYMEGIKGGEHLVQTLKEASLKKPVIVIKSGRSKRGAVAAASHTGSLAGADEIFTSVMDQCGVMRAESLDEAFNLCKFFSTSPMPRGNNTVIVTNGGGIGVMATDACEKYGVELYDDQDKLKKIFGPATPDFGSTKNPVDITGQATPEFYDDALGAAIDSPDIHSIMALYCETAVFTTDTLTDMVLRNYKRCREAGKPVVFNLVGGKSIKGCMERLTDSNVPVFEGSYTAVACLGALYEYDRYRKLGADTIEEGVMDIGRIREILNGVLDDDRGFLLPHEASEVMELAGLPYPKSRIASTLDQAVSHAEEIGYPVVLKVASRDILHKSDVGGVALDLDDRQELMDAYQAIMQNCKTRMPDARITGVEVSEMVKKGTEVIVGARRDIAFGPIVMFGLGGIYVEVMKDVAFRAVPLNREEVTHMIQEIRSYPLLLGVRGEKRKDIPNIVKAVIKLATLIRNCPEITDIEINPLMVYEQGSGVKAVDARIMVEGLEHSR